MGKSCLLWLWNFETEFHNQIPLQILVISKSKPDFEYKAIILLYLNSLRPSDAYMRQ